ncbi:hypothetical protein Tco_0530262 [Tanacetum coccineum]
MKKGVVVQEQNKAGSSRFIRQEEGIDNDEVLPPVARIGSHKEVNKLGGANFLKMLISCQQKADNIGLLQQLKLSNGSSCTLQWSSAMLQNQLIGANGYQLPEHHYPY